MANLDEEKELEDYLYSRQENGSPFFEPTGEFYGHVYRQFSIPPYGVMDLLYVNCDYHDEIGVRVVELKKNPIDHQAIKQIARYRQGLIHHFSLLFPDENKRPKIDIAGALIGPSLGDGANYLIDSISWLECYSYALDLQSGIKFEEECGVGDELHWRRTDTKTTSSLSKFKRFLMKEYAVSKRNFFLWQKEWEEKKRNSNVVDFK